ncbi:MAG: LysR family transcriptional regulator [Chloroflexi bacterium]|nr:LysR family transcriptional regulator [Chloroflexota bacterium]
MEPHCKLWLEEDGKVAMSDYRLQLLQCVDETGSLAAAAKQMDLSYRRAWGKIRDIEKCLGLQLVASVSGGANGGGSRLTPEGADIIRSYQRFSARAREAVAQSYRAEFSRWRAGRPASVAKPRSEAACE